MQLGIEKIRAVDERHGLHVQLLIYLGKSFGSKVCTTVNSTKQDKACGSGAESQFVMNRLNLIFNLDCKTVCFFSKSENW